ncbi:hypothetical protein [Maledivibacter halophilus]|uniref:Uncharacterized protein n=1 Tax=Maledivibacter halophilus TaxID=36842 RepID=A0A1T5MQS5_9FIRM|nr:hypothetical protein [Maledivibacter halophilus]SKC90552.1 hypothetical protein SAMN02194393_05185 [Maledivibacter halophilus]
MEVSIHTNIIKNFIKKLGLDDTDNYLRDQLLITSKKVIVTREEIDKIIELTKYQDNSDEKLHLKYKLEETKDKLKNLLKKLKATDEMYLCFKSYIKNNNQLKY